MGKPMIRTPCAIAPLETTTAEIGKTVHPHPTLSEAIMEAALAAEGEAINY